MYSSKSGVGIGSSRGQGSFESRSTSVAKEPMKQRLTQHLHLFLTGSAEGVGETLKKRVSETLARYKLTLHAPGDTSEACVEMYNSI